VGPLGAASGAEGGQLRFIIGDGAGSRRPRVTGANIFVDADIL